MNANKSLARNIETAIATPSNCRQSTPCNYCIHSNHCTDERNQVKPKEFTNFCTTVVGEWGNRCMYPIRLDLYDNGCIHNCRYCYARAIHIRYKRWNTLNPSVADIAKVERKIQKLPPGSIVRLGGMTDNFQPIEMKYKITLETIKLLNKYGIRYMIVTKSPLVSYPPYLNAMDKDLAHIQISVTSLDLHLKRLIENTLPPDQLVHAIYTLQNKSFDVAIRLSPLIEEYMDFDELNKLGIDKCIVEFLRVNAWMRGLPLINYSKYTYKHKNYLHLPLEEKLRIISKIKIPNITVCEKVPRHHDHWMADFNPNKADCCNLRISSPQILMDEINNSRLPKDIREKLLNGITGKEIMRENKKKIRDFLEIVGKPHVYPKPALEVLEGYVRYILKNVDSPDEFKDFLRK